MNCLLKSHTEQKHLERVWRCPVCQSMFNGKHQLKQHLVKTHGDSETQPELSISREEYAKKLEEKIAECFPRTS